MATAFEQSPDTAARPAGAALAPGWLDRHPATVSLALFAACLALTLPLLGRQSIWFDEAVTMSNVQLPYDLGRYLRADATPPLYPLLVHLWMQVFGIGLVAARALSALASAASVVLLFQLGRRFLDARTGLFAAALLATSRCQIFFAHEARPYALVLLLVIASFHVLLALLERVTWRRLVVLCLLDAALLYTHYVAAFALVAQALAALPAPRQSPRTFLSILASQACAVLLVVPLAIYVATVLWPLPMAGWLPPPTWRSIPNELAKLTGSGTLLALEALLVLAGAIVLRRATAAGGDAGLAPRTVAVLVLWVVAPLVTAFAVSSIEPVFLGRYLLYTTPGWYLLVAAVAARLPIGGALRATLVAALCALSLAGAWRSPIERPAWATAADRVHAATAAGALAIVVPAHEMLPFAWHFSPESFRDLDHLTPRLRDAGVIGVPRLGDVQPLLALPRELLLVVPQPAAAGVDVLVPALGVSGRGTWQREDLHGIVLLRVSAPRAAAGSAAPLS